MSLFEWDFEDEDFIEEAEKELYRSHDYASYGKNWRLKER